MIPNPKESCFYKIQEGIRNEYVAIGNDGNILRWAETGGSEQEFSFVNCANGWWNIQIGTGREFVAVGSNGNILRWAKTGGNEQKFKLVPVRPMAKPQLQPGDSEPGAIGDVPRITGFGMIPPE